MFDIAWAIEEKKMKHKLILKDKEKLKLCHGYSLDAH